MIEFLFPWVLIASPLPLIIWLFSKAKQPQLAAIRTPLFSNWSHLQNKQSSSSSKLVIQRIITSCFRFGWKQNFSNFIEYQLPGLPPPHLHDWMTIYSWSGSNPPPPATLKTATSSVSKLKRSNSLSNIV